MVSIAPVSILSEGQNVATSVQRVVCTVIMVRTGANLAYSSNFTVIKSIKRVKSFETFNYMPVQLALDRSILVPS